MSENVYPDMRLTTPQRKALEALIAGASRNQAATVAGRTRRTVDRWIKDDLQFAGELKQATNDAVSDATRRMAAMLDDAQTALEKAISDPDNNSEIIRIVNTLAGNLIRLREFDELESRIQALEEQLSNGWP
jgi:polyhydroxyalkanoate synthesis regulator phasin